MYRSSIWTSVLTASVLGLGCGSVANAADLGGSGPPLLDSAPLLVDEFGSNWYLRGDIGYRFNTDFDSARNLNPPPAVQNPELTNKTWNFGGGVGYKWEWFRTDLTFDVSTTAKFDADSRRRVNDFTAKVDNYNGLWNAYADLGTWWGFSPYIGGGVGFARLKASGFRISSEHDNEGHSNETWNFAWAAMAGLSYRVNANWLIDVGYRHIDMGDVWTGVFGSGRFRDERRLEVKNLSSDEVRVGFRYMID
jgi:opacity protein-like surface antigen